MFLSDRLTLDNGRRRTRDGYLAIRAKAARTGTYDYLGSEIDPENKYGLRDAGLVKVLRDESTVFDEVAARSFVGKPVTDNHPSSAVTADNWKDNARGIIMGVMRDGQYLAYDLLLTDAATIAKVDDGKRELSNGYAAELEFGDFEAPDGTKCVARQTKIVGNHVALVDRGRAGSECRIADAVSCDPIPRTMLTELLDHIIADERTYTANPVNDKNGQSNVERQSGVYQMPHTLIIDGLQVPNVSDEAKAAIEKLQGANTALVADKATLETKVGEQAATIATRDGEITALKQQVKDAEINPDKLQQLVADRAQLVAKAKAVDPNVVTDGKTDAEIRGAIVKAKLGDAAPTDDNGIAGAFAALTADTKVDPVAGAIAAKPAIVADSGASVRDLARAAQY